MTEDIEVGRYSQAAPDHAAEFKEEKDTPMASEEKKPHWQYALSELDLLPESDTVLLWLARFPIENNHPRPLVGTSGCIAAGEVLTVLEEEKLPYMFQKLVTEGFLGVPVVDNDHRFEYFIDLLDLVHYVCDMFQEYMQGSNEVFYVPSEPKLKEDWSRFFQLDRYQNATVREVAARSRAKMPLSYPSFRGFSTFSAMEQMARLGPHRVSVLDRERHVVGILTQSMVISLLDQNIDKLGQFRECSVREMVPALATQAICVPETSLTIDAFRLMATNRITGLGVTNSDNSLVDIISVRDLRGIGVKAEHFERLWHSVKRYKDEVRREFHRQTPPKPIHVTRDNTLRDVVRRMDDGNIHRVFVVEKERREEGGEEVWRPTHVITQRDVMRFLMFKMGLQPIWEVEPIP